MKIRFLLRPVSAVAALAICGIFPAAFAQQAPASAAGDAKEYRAFLDKYCVACHSDKAKTAGLTLETADVATVAQHPEIWEKVVRKLRAGAMPPQGMPQPGRPSQDRFAGWLEDGLDRAAANLRPGRPLIHRLNRTEYVAAVKDVLGVEVDAESLLPADSSSFGFDNNADTLTVSPALLEKYLDAADKISVLALGDPKAPATATKYPIKFDLSQNQRMEGMPLGTSGGTLIRYNFPADGEYVFSGRLYGAHNSQDRGQMGEDATTYFEISVDGKRVSLVHFGGKDEEWATYKSYMVNRDDIRQRMTTRVFVKAGVHAVGFGFIDRKLHEQGVQTLYRPADRQNVEGSEAGGPAQLESVQIDGPYKATGVSETASRRKILVCQPGPKTDEVACARKILTALAQGAYRRPVTEADTETLLTYFQRGKNSGTFDDGIKLAISRMLTSTDFLFRTEIDPRDAPANGSYRLSDLELASRLSFFLWSTVPDEQLLAVATKNKLRDPAVLEQQVKRMLADRRSHQLVVNVTGQWLGLRAVPNLTPNPQVYHDFDDQVRQGIRTETEMLFESVMREDRNVFDLVNADYTFVNERLARFYGIPGVGGNEFRRVAVTDENRRGLLGQASILTLSSNSTRTSPVKRGKWILSTLLSIPPPPPPPNVPPLAENGAGDAPKSVRERLELHRANTFCAGCHRTIDPPGFALENFNPVGQWRTTTEDGKPVDGSGVLWDGTKVSSPADLRKAIMNRSDLFLSTLTERMLTYAYGRGIDFAEIPVIRTIDREAAKNNYRFSTIVLGIVKSSSFQMRSGPGVEAVQSAALSAPATDK